MVIETSLHYDARSEKQCCDVRLRRSRETELDLNRGAARLQRISSTVSVVDIFDLRGHYGVDTRNE